MDKSTIPGIIIGLGGILIGATLEGTKLGSLIMLPAFLIVFVGTLGTVMVSFPMSIVASLPKYFAIAVKEKHHDAGEVVETFVRLADRARREGLLALEQEAGGLEPFAARGIQMVVDGSDPALVRDVLEADIESMQARHKHGAAIFEAMGGYSPTMGIIGTVMGLVHVLENLANPDELGHLIAAAFIATLYGVAFANCIFLPMGTKLKVKSQEEAHHKELIVEGVLAVQAGDNPRMVREKLEAFLSPKERGGADAAKGGGAPAAKAA
jgi:chemotaxis protein MotA